LAHLAVKTGIWPLKEAVNGVVRHTFIPKRFLPVEEYLRPQLRFRHLFEPKPHTEALETIQERVDHYWEQVKKHEAGNNETELKQGKY
jgi:pyruvate ferredoxin oxidoreductase beta subunit